MISGQWSYRRILRIDQKLHKITHNSIEKMGSTLILTNLVGVHPRKICNKFAANHIHRKFEANACFGLRCVKNGILHSDI